MARSPLPRQRAVWLWSRRLAEPGWLLLPLRGFLGITFAYAGLQKLANPAFLDPSSPASLASQMRTLQHSSPIGPLLALSAHASTLLGLLIALGELAVGLGALLGLYTRVAAVGGALLALTFFLTVSWTTTPYYYGADIVFVFAWLTLLGFGDRGVLSLHSWVRARARASLRLGPQPATIAVSADRLYALCPRGGGCGLGPDGVCTWHRGCPVFPVTERLHPSTRAEVDRRTALHAGAATALTATAAAALAGLTYGIGRMLGGTGPHRSPAALLPPTARPPRSPAPETSPHAASPRTPAVAGTAIGAAADIPRGQARSFTDPASGDPAWVVHPSGARFVAFDAVCTHAGCTVRYDPSQVQFLCPCHGGVYDARTGQVLQGPPPAPLRSIPVHVAGGQVRVDG